MFNVEQVQRYSRHMLLPEVGVAGQLKLLDASVVAIGAGGLGSPVLYYLAAAGVGKLGVVDFDVVDRSNLQRQILHREDRVGLSKTGSAAETLTGLNSDVEVIEHNEPLTSENAMEILGAYDVIVNGCDNFPTRYLVNDAAYMLGKPVVDGSVLRFEGMSTVFVPGDGLLPLPLPDAAAARNGAELLRGRRAGRVAGFGRPHPGDGDDQDHPGHRRHTCRTPVAVRCPRHGVPRAQAPAGSQTARCAATLPRSRS